VWSSVDLKVEMMVDCSHTLRDMEQLVAGGSVARRVRGLCFAPRRVERAGLGVGRWWCGICCPAGLWRSAGVFGLGRDVLWCSLVVWCGVVWCGVAVAWHAVVCSLVTWHAVVCSLVTWHAVWPAHPHLCAVLSPGFPRFEAYETDLKRLCEAYLLRRRLWGNTLSTQAAAWSKAGLPVPKALLGQAGCAVRAMLTAAAQRVLGEVESM
jgi:hypothetical protein